MACRPQGGRLYAKKEQETDFRKIVLRLPDLDHAKSAVLSSLSSPSSRRNYKFAMDQFITWYFSEPRIALNRVWYCDSGCISNHSVWVLQVRYGTETCTVLLAGPVLPSAAT